MAVTEIAGKVLEVADPGSDRNGFRLRVDCDDTPVECVGYGLVNIGDHIVCAGHWVRKPSGAHFVVSHVTPILPNSESDLLEYLSSGKVRTIGPALAETIVRAFGVKALEIIADSPTRLMTIDGIGHERVKVLHEAVSEHFETMRLRSALTDIGLTNQDMALLAKRYRHRLFDRLMNAPYDVIAAYPLFNFRSADRFCDVMSISVTDAQRQMACLRCVVHEYERKHGISAAPASVIQDKLTSFGISASLEDISKEDEPVVSLDDPMTEERFFVSRYHNDFAKGIARALEERCYYTSYLAALFEARSDGVQECATANSLHLAIPAYTSATIVDEQFHRGGIQWVAELLRLVRHFEPSSKITVTSVTGGGADMASRLLEAPVSTVHKCLGLSVTKMPNSPALKNSEPDVFIVFEGHLLDARLLYSIFQQVPLDASIIIVGDSALSHSQSGDNVWPVLPASPYVARIHLAERVGSWLPEPLLARRLRLAQRCDGIVVCNDVADLMKTLSESSVCALWTAGDSETRRTLDNLLPVLFDTFDPKTVQIAVAGHKGLLGTLALNRDYSGCFNPIPGRRQDDPTVDQIHIGIKDRLRVHRNINTEGLRTGDLVTVTSIDCQAKRIRADHRGREVCLSYQHLSRMRLAFVQTASRLFLAPTPVVILVLDERASFDHNWQFLYAAALGSTSRVILVGPKQIYERCVKTDALADRGPSALSLHLTTQRYSRLSHYC